MVDELPDDDLRADRRAVRHKRLLDSGLACGIPCPATLDEISRFTEWKPIRMDGEPAPQTLIRERR